MQTCFCEGMNAWLSCQPCISACTLNSGDTVNHHQFAGGDFFSCGVTSTGGVKCWGSNTVGQLGDASDAGRTIPGDVPGLTGVVSVVAGAGHACALNVNGGVKCWGGNSAGTLGDRSTFDRPTPVDVFGLTSGVKAIAAGVGHTCALTTAGGLKCWGGNSKGQLGDRTSNNYSIQPIDVYGLTSGVLAVAAGQEHTCAVVTGGAVRCWGTGTWGENGSTTMATAPIAVSGITNARSLSAGWNHTCALLQGGAVKCWGWNWAGQLGRGVRDALNPNPAPQAITTLLYGVSELSSGIAHSCALMNDGSAYCWGWNGWGQLGNGQAGNMGGTPTVSVNAPTRIYLPPFSVQLGSGSRHNCAFGPGHALLCWGENMLGQLGDNSTTQRTSPVSVPGF